jgi:peptide-methionine (S)-S-oxide reductase
VARGDEDRDLRPRLLLGRREGLLGAARRRDDGLSATRGRNDPEPDVQGGLHGPDRSREVVLVAYDPKRISYEQLLKTFWEDHDPTQGFRQGNDIGTQYRSIILTTDDEQQRIAEMSRDAYQAMLSAAGYGEIKTEIQSRGPFYYAEDYHQQYSTRCETATARSTPDGREAPRGTSR